MNEYDTLDDLLQEMIDIGASDLHLNHNTKVTYRVDGSLLQSGKFIQGDQIFDMLIDAKAIKSAQNTILIQTGNIDFSYSLGLTRFRGSLSNQRENYSCVFRKIDSEIIPIDELDFPPIIKKIVGVNWGMILITGPTGSGKSRTLASIIDYINANQKYHITTIEQPLEYLHKNKQSIVTQVEVGVDIPSFHEGLRSSLRRDPDVIMVGEMRDYETISTALEAAETGHLVFGTLHTNTAPHSVSRIVGKYPSAEHDKIRNELSLNLRAVIAQRLFPKPGGGRTAVFEIMIVGEEIRELIRTGQVDKIHEAMEKDAKAGNILMEDSIRRAKERNLIFPDVQW